MIKRTLFFSHAVCLSLKNKQLLVTNKETQEEITIPIEDIGFVIIENLSCYISIPLLNELASNNSAVIFCNEKHMPFTMNLPLDCNSVQSQVFSIQINSKLPIKKKCWKQIIESKIENQSYVLKKYNKDYLRLLETSKDVKSGDSTNREGYAAKLYWDNLIGNDWIRTRNGEYPNNLLNYGYAILRAAVARALIGSGLLPTLGINHHNKYNAYCLADDVMEPYRPYVDDEVYDFIVKNPLIIEINQEFKKKILNILTRDVRIGKVIRPLMIALSMTTASLVDVLSEKSDKLVLPSFL